ncbi:copper chaperone PCu(A)C [Conchiformibius kuhniae]|uniref:Copper chaperone PCu(A)C n=1 Tax=Conchiformibius kuhniae TaxID=211502 RepID=A0A8T9MQE4_9NEIS|nr:copper chaperone PCu(A)C [Conchiformibius kuhniae]UOP04120.1 copper chaperone PCu(A)C [Conchiformibius kuhniae]
MLKQALLALALCASVGAWACEAHGGKDGGAYARPTVAGQKQGGAFLTLRNPDAQPKTLVSAHTDIAARTELHTHVHENGVMKMREVKGGITIPAKGSVELKPGGLHIMFFDLKQPLEAGKTFPLTLKYDNGSSETVTVNVKTMRGTRKHGHHRHGHKHEHNH